MLTDELGRLKQERAGWQHRVKLLQSSSIDPDTLDERARAVLNYLDPRDLTLMLKQP
jgi:cell division protein FtsB